LLLGVFCLLDSRTAFPHDLERTQVMLTLSRDGSFVLDVANDPAWLKLRLESIQGPFVDRIVLFADGHEARPASDEFIPGDALATHRLRGTLPPTARTLRWYYGLVIDPYPLTVRHADGRIQTEVVAGDAWSREIDVRGEFNNRSRWVVVAIVLAFAGALGARWRSRLTIDGTRDTKEKTV
jgi:hypothetical protein